MGFIEGVWVELVLLGFFFPQCDGELILILIQKTNKDKNMVACVDKMELNGKI